MSWSNYPTAAPGLVPTWQDPDCTCGHRPHEGFCPTVTCPCNSPPPKCSVCMHRDHGSGKDCFAGGVREAQRCLCKGPGITTRQELTDDAFGPRGRNQK